MPNIHRVGMEKHLLHSRDESLGKLFRSLLTMRRVNNGHRSPLLKPDISHSTIATALVYSISIFDKALHKTSK